MSFANVRGLRWSFLASASFSLCIFVPTCFADFLVGTAFEGAILRVDESTGELLPGGVPAGSAGLELPSGIAVSPDGNIYVSSRGTGEVLFFDGQTGFRLPSPQLNGRPGLFAALDPGGAPGPLRFDPDGNLYVSDLGGTSVLKFNGTTGASMGVAATAFVGPPAGLAFDGDGNLYFGDFGSASVIKQPPAGDPSLFVAPQSGGLQTASSLLFLPDGELLVVDLYGNQILKFDENGQNPETFAVIPPEIPNPLPPNANIPSNSPSDAILDSNGDLVVAVLGLTYDNVATLLRYDFSGDDPEILLDNGAQFGSIARIDFSTFLFGDYDRNGFVQPADYDKWKSDFGKSVTIGEGADGNGDGLVDAADYVVWREHYFIEVESGKMSTVPEPAAMRLLLWGALFAGRSRIRGRI
ncbi:MAG: hypothetical protein WD468_09595 [Pirellulales bacterium]